MNCGDTNYLQQFAIREGGRRLRARADSRRWPADVIVVSIVTVVRNAANTIERTIRSVLAQRYPHIEYIIIDGASNDGTVDILRQYDEQLDYWLSEPDRGIASAFNKGLSFASGEVIGILNGDDWYEPDAILAAVRAFGLAPDAGVVCGQARYCENRGRSYVAAADSGHLLREMTVNHGATFVRRSVYRKCGAFDPSYQFAMDYELMLRFKMRGVSFMDIDVVLCNVQCMGASDRNWVASIAEVRRAKQSYGNRLARLYQSWMVTRSLSSRVLSRIGLSVLVARFRRNFSIVRKQ